MAFFKSLLWILLSIFFGMLQIWIVFGYENITSSKLLSNEKIILDGVLLFFITGIVSSIAIDFFLSKENYNRAIVGFLFVLYPFIVIITAVCIYCITINKVQRELNMDSLKSLHIVLIAMTIIYTVITKIMQFKS